jgi:TolB-like protein/class 3 adenylate cyclase
LTGERVERRLAAVLAADVAGYSRLMGADEEGTLARLKAVRKTLVDPTIAKHRGRIVKTTGDGMLVEFASAVDAARCAVAVQLAMTGQNADAPLDARIELRIGIHVGDIIIDDNDIFGDGVNIAARLEAIAEPGGVCMSDDTYRQVRGKVETGFDDSGFQSLKNIAEPIRVWRVQLGGRNAVAGQPDALAPQVPTLVLPDKPSIAVLPFQNMSGDPEQDYFADGMVEEIITALSRFKSLFVIARNSTFTYKGKAVDIKQVGRELGVHYVLEGSVRKAGGRVRITGQLIEANTGQHLWADRFDGALEDVFDLQDKVSEKVVSAIAPRVWDAEINRSKRKPTEQLEAYDFLLRSLAAFVPGDRGAVEAAHAFALQAIELDHEFGAAYGRATLTYCNRKQSRWMKDVTSETAEGLRLARLAVRFGKNDDIALSLGGVGLGYLGGEVEAGASFIDQALALNPNAAQAWTTRAWFYIWQGHHDRAIDYLSRAIRLNPREPIMAFAGMGLAHLFCKRWHEAETWAGEATHRAPTFLPPLRPLAASLAFQGKIDEARKVGALILRLDPSFCLSNLLEYLPIQREEDIALMNEGLRLAGIPE